MNLTLKRTHPGVPHERYGQTQWTVMMEGYGYSCGHIAQDDAKGWVPYNIGRSDWGAGHVESAEFKTREEACAHVRAVLESQQAAAANVIAKAHEMMLPYLGKAKCTDERYRDALFVVGIISPLTKLSVRTLMTPEMTLACLDFLAFPGGLTEDTKADAFTHWVLTVEGMCVSPEQVTEYLRCPNCHAFAQWTIPNYSSDYHLPGWQSTSGMGRRKGER